MKLLTANFDELYRRHLCRHSQLGLNVLHLLAVVGIYYGLCGLVSAALRAAGVAQQWPAFAVLLTPYLLVLALNLPARVWIATLATIVVIVAASQFAPPLPWWVNLLLILGLHQFQQWSHRLYPLQHDMSGFQQKYVKGPRLSVLLAVYELPILLQYLLFGQSDWVRGTESRDQPDHAAEPASPAIR